MKMGFSKEFIWGAASAAHQIEGAYNEDGKALGIWDVLYKGHVKRDENAHISADHYHHMKEDVALMKEIGLQSYRFSISWPRVISGRGVVNQKGLDFYNELVDELLAAGIEPMVTLYHWNLPMWSYEYGGWKSEEIVEDFAFYTKVIVEALSDRVKYFMTINEPQSFVKAGYVSGHNAPFEQCPELEKVISRNVMLAHGKSVQTMRKYAKQPLLIGMALIGTGNTPWDNTPEEIESAKKATFSMEKESESNIWWADPMVLGVVPEKLKDVISEEDIKVICQPLDYYGFNVYYSKNYARPNGRPNPKSYLGLPRTAMNWPITPEVLYWMPKFFYERYGLPIMIMENGMANMDFVMSDGGVHDPQRIEYIRWHLQNLKKVVDDGVPVIGYQYWSIMDNFEWAEGFDKRFGLIYVDYRTGQRVLKDSAYEYKKIIETNGEVL